MYVGPFKKRNERADTRSENYTNLYVKHFPDCWEEETLRTVFTPFGMITSLALNTDSKGRRFGFINYEDCDSAKAAVAELHGKKTSEQGVCALFMCANTIGFRLLLTKVTTSQRKSRRRKARRRLKGRQENRRRTKRRIRAIFMCNVL